jgi:CheY-like chemotaxis protein
MAYTIHAYLFGGSSYSRMSPPAAHHVPAIDGAVLEHRHGIKAMETVGTRDFPRPDEKTPAGLRVLVVDDEPLIRWSVAETLADRGHEVVETGDALGARSAVGDERRAFDVVLLDYRLPDSDDLSLLAAIRRLCPKAQVILMTAFGRPEVVRGALDLGAYRVISKPFEMSMIADLVAQAYAAGPGAQKH